MTADPNIIATIRKNSLEEVRVSLTEYQGKPLVDLRIFAAYRSSGEVGPTKKGITVNVALIPELRKALQDAEAECLQSGLLVKE